MKITFLGTGSSTGVPIITCKCRVCTSSNQKNKRLRASILITTDEGRKIVIDTSTDFRQQCLSNGITDLDAIFYTHSHADHILGLDEIRAFNFRHKKPIPVFGSKLTLDSIMQTFHYILKPLQRGGGVPQVELNFIEKSEFKIFDEIVVEAIPVLHGIMEVFAYKIGNFAYVTDFNNISERSRSKLKNLDLLILGILREKPHSSHFCLEEGLQLVEELKPKRTFVTHTSHIFEYEEFNKNTPENFEMAFDGLIVEV